MKKLLRLFAPLMCVLGLTSCGGNAAPAKYDLNINCIGCTIDGLTNFSKKYNEGSNVNLQISANSNYRFLDGSLSDTSSNFTFDYKDSSGTLLGVMDKNYSFTIKAYGKDIDSHTISFELNRCIIIGKEGSNPIFEYPVTEENITFSLISTDDKYEFDSEMSIWKKDIDNDNCSFEVDLKDRKKATLIIKKLRSDYSISIEPISICNNYSLTIQFNNCSCPELDLEKDYITLYFREGSFVSIDGIYAESYHVFNEKSFMVSSGVNNLTFSYDESYTKGKLEGRINNNIACVISGVNNDNTSYVYYNLNNCKVFKPASFIEVGQSEDINREFKVTRDCYAEDGYCFNDDSCIYYANSLSDYSFVIDPKDNTHAILTFRPTETLFLNITAVKNEMAKFELSINLRNCIIFGNSGNYSLSYYAGVKFVIPITESDFFHTLDSSCCTCDVSTCEFNFDEEHYYGEYWRLEFVLTENLSFTINSKEETQSVSLDIIFSNCTDDEESLSITYGTEYTYTIYAANNYIFDSSSLIKPDGTDAVLKIQPDNPSIAVFKVTMNGNYDFQVNAVPAPAKHTFAFNCDHCYIETAEGHKTSGSVEYYEGAFITLKVIADEGYILETDTPWSESTRYEWTRTESNHKEGTLTFTMPSNDCHIGFKTYSPDDDYYYLSVNGNNCLIEGVGLYDGAFTKGSDITLDVTASDGYLLTNESFEAPEESDFTFTLNPDDNTKGTLAGTVSGNYNLEVSTETTSEDYYALNITCNHVKVNGKSPFKGMYFKETEVNLKVTCEDDYMLEENSLSPYPGFTLTIDPNDNTIGYLKGCVTQNNIALTISTNTKSYKLNVICDNCEIAGSNNFVHSYERGASVSLAVSAIGNGTLSDNFDDKGSNFTLILTEDKKSGILSGTMQGSYTFNLEGFMGYQEGVDLFGNYIKTEDELPRCNLRVKEVNFTEKENDFRNSIFSLLNECGLEIYFNYGDEPGEDYITLWNPNCSIPRFNNYSEYSFRSDTTVFKKYDDGIYVKSSSFMLDLFNLNMSRLSVTSTGTGIIEMKLNEDSYFEYISLSFDNYALTFSLEEFSVTYVYDGFISFTVEDVLTPEIYSK